MTTLNEVIVFAITFCTNIAEDRVIGLVVNFSAALIVSEFDEIIMTLGKIN